MNIRTFRPWLALTAALILLSTNGHAHPGHAHGSGDIGWGLAHPFTGLDHLLAAFAVGMLAALWRRVSVGVVFLCAGAAGGFAGAQLGAFIGLESLLALSVIALGVAIALHRQFARSASLVMIALGAAVHGWAHGSEGAGTASLAGIVLGTAAIAAMGAAVAFVFRRTPRAITAFGATIALAAYAILVAAI